MNARTLTWLGSVAMLLLLGRATSADVPDAFQKANLAEESRLWLVGDSTLHHYESDAKKIELDARFAAGPGSIDEKLRSGGLTELEVTIPVRDMKSHSAQLDRNMQKAMRAKANPDIVFQMSHYEVSDSTAPDAFLVHATGTLTVAGVPKPVTLEAMATRVDGGVRIEGVQDVLMTDHGIKPPVLLMIKTRDLVQVHYDLVVR